MVKYVNASPALQHFIVPSCPNFVVPLVTSFAPPSQHRSPFVSPDIHNVPTLNTLYLFSCNFPRWPLYMLSLLVSYTARFEHDQVGSSRMFTVEASFFANRPPFRFPLPFNGPMARSLC